MNMVTFLRQTVHIDGMREKNVFTENERVALEFDAQVWVCGELRKLHTYVNMFRDAFNAEGKIPGIVKVESLEDPTFWEIVTADVEALQDELYRVVLEDNYDPKKLVFGTKASIIFEVTLNGLDMCELECKFYERPEVLF